MKKLHALTLAAALSLAQGGTSQAVTFNVTMDLAPLTHDFYRRDYMLAVEWSEAFIGTNVLTLSDVTGIVPTGPPFFGGSADITQGLRFGSGSVFGQAFTTTDQPLHMTVSLTNNCTTSVFECNDGTLGIGIVPVGQFGSDETFLRFAVDRPLGIAVNTQIIPTSATGYEVLQPHTSPFAPTPEPGTFGLMIIGIVAFLVARHAKERH